MSVAQAQTVLAKIRTRGYWRVIIRPSAFVKEHIKDYAELCSIVPRYAVRFRGWDYPHIDTRRQPERGADWVGQECDCEDELEVWRLYQSGQFIHYFGIAGDWRDQSELRPAESGWNWGKDLEYVSTVHSLLEIYEFAARLAQSPAGSAMMHVEIGLHLLMGRQLINERNPALDPRDHRTEMSEWIHHWNGMQTELIARPRELAASAARELFLRFAFNVSIDALLRVQQIIGR